MTKMKPSREDDSEGYRYERKFVPLGLTLHEVEALVKIHPSIFHKVFLDRFVNNIYFDSIDKKSYADNLDGVAKRMKVRVRWYGNLMGDTPCPTLEFKLKSGLAGKKLRFHMEPFDLNKPHGLKAVANMIKEMELPERLKETVKHLGVTVINRYRRQYYLSVDRRFRVTIDSDMEYYRACQTGTLLSQNSVDNFNTVVEIKYGLSHDEGVEKIVKHFPFRLSRNSKYVNGIQFQELELS